MPNYRFNSLQKKALSRFLLFLFLLIFSSSIQAAQIDPSFKFSTIETEHFLIHYHQGLEKLAHKSTGMAEEIHNLLTSTFSWTPVEKTHLTLIDSSDISNGFATVLPYNSIYIYTVPPMPDMSIGQYEDWLKLVITHEYTHILTMDPVRGYSKVMRNIFGKTMPGSDPLSFLLFFATVPPNILLPRWWLEGTATWAESQYNQMGRGKSTYYEMIFRTAVADDNLLSIDKINGEIPYWPAGGSVYIYGLALQRFIARYYGAEELGGLNIAHSGRAPYFINGAAVKVTSKNYVSLYRDMLSELRKEHSKKIDILKTASLTDINTFDINIKGERLTNPRISRDGKFLALNNRDPHKHESIVIVDKNGQKQTTVIDRLVSDHNITWSPDGQRIFFTQAEIHRTYNLYQDLYSYDIKKNRLKRLTDGMRVKDPDISPDGKTFAFVTVAADKQSLAFLDADGSEESLNIVSQYQGMRVSGPRWSTDGKSIVFSVRDLNGKTSLQIYSSAKNSTGKTLEVILEDTFDNIYPTWSPDDRFIVFTSDRTGVYNLFAYSLSEKKIYQITNLIGGALQPEISPDGKRIYFSSYDSRGFKIAWIDYVPEDWRTKIGPVIKIDWPSDKEIAVYKTESNSKKSENLEPEKLSGENVKGQGRQYSALASLLPRFWLPTIRSDPDGPVLGAFTAGRDVLGYHTYMAEAGRGVSGQNYYDITYIYDRFYPTLRLSAYALPTLYSRLSDSGDNLYEKRSGFIAGVSLPLTRLLESNYTLRFGYHRKRRELLQKTGSTSKEGLGGKIFEEKRDNVFAGIEFNNALRYPYSISREEGRIISLYYRNYSKTLRSDVNSQEYIGSYEEFLRLTGHSVLYTKLKAVISKGDINRRQEVGGIPNESLDFPLRGYPSRLRTGKHVATATLEFRQPIVYPLRGINTKPIFFDKLHIAPFADAGIVWNKKTDFNWKKVDIGVGVEARFDLMLGYRFRITPALGIARGINRDGETMVYINIYTQL